MTPSHTLAESMAELNCLTLTSIERYYYIYLFYDFLAESDEEIITLKRSSKMKRSPKSRKKVKKSMEKNTMALPTETTQ